VLFEALKIAQAQRFPDLVMRHQQIFPGLGADFGGIG
jgi:hypothetical protein